LSKKFKKSSRNRRNYIIGIDEVGRGALAGPVVVAAVAAPIKFKIQNSKLRIKKKTKNSAFLILNSKLAPLRDSKKLSSKQREEWFKWIKKHTNKLKNVSMFYAVESVSPKIIDKINISQAANLAATSALKALIKNYKLRIQNCKVYLDGGLYLRALRIENRELRSDNKIKNCNSQSSILNSQTIIKGDEKIPAIALASIVAKVHRDKLMKRLHKKYSRYDFINNVGYGVKKHIKAIKKYGLSPIHRKSFKIH